MANELPSLGDLQGTYGYASPMAYQQAAQNQDLAGMFQQQKLFQEGNATQKGLIENQQSEDMNPLLVNQQQLVNTNRDQTNQTQGLQLQRDYALQGKRLQQDQLDAIQKMTDSDFAAIQQHGQKLMYSSDPAEQAQGQQIVNASKEAYLVKQKFERDQQLEKMKTDSAARVAGIGASATLGAAQIGADSRAEVARLMAERTIQAKQMSQNLNQYLVTLNKMPASPERDQQIVDVTQQLQAANPAFGSAIDTSQFGVPRNAQAAPTAAPTAKAPPAVGTVYKGHVFLGGNPADKNNWKAQ